MSKVHRVTAAAETIISVLSEPPATRLSIPSILLTAACTWMIAAINARPQDWADHKTVTTACLPVNRDPETEELSALLMGGTFLIHRIEPVEETWGVRCRESPRLEEALPRMFGFRNMNLLREFLLTCQRRQNAMAAPPGTALPRQPTHAGTTTREPVAPDDPEHGTFFEFGELELLGDGVQDRVTRHWQQIWAEVFGKVPNESGGGASWLTEEFLLGTDQHFGAFLGPEPGASMVDYLFTVFRNYQSRVATFEQWNNAFNCLFPGPGWVRGPHTGGYAQLSCFETFNVYLTQQAEKADGNAALILDALRKRFNTLKWAPAMTVNKLWKSGNTRVGGWSGQNLGVCVYIHHRPAAVDPMGIIF